ncbi:MAG TPA: YraN family protein [Candidatus Lumbricidophila sp.]|nr:YraN family protein [Candidatus Lumbricidophila sp.]
MTHNQTLGARGEQLAADHLEALGMEILTRNWRCREGELDIVARDGADLVCVEVKTRSTTSFGHPFEAVTAQKLSRLRRLAALWCQASDASARCIRIDVVSVLDHGAAGPVIEHLRGVN